MLKPNHILFTCFAFLAFFSSGCGPSFKNEVIDQGDQVYKTDNPYEKSELTIHKVYFDYPSTDMEGAFGYNAETDQIVKIDITLKNLFSGESPSTSVDPNSFSAYSFNLTNVFQKRIVNSNLQMKNAKDAFPTADKKGITIKSGESVSYSLYYIVKGKGLVEADRTSYVLEYNSLKIPLKGRN